MSNIKKILVLFGGCRFYVYFCKYHLKEYYRPIYGLIIIMLTFTNKSMAAPEVVRNLGIRFRDYRMRMRMTRKDVSKSKGYMSTIVSYPIGTES